MARVLLIEDDRVTMQLLSDIINQYAKHYYHSPWDLRVSKATTAEEGLELLNQHSFELILTDIMLARMDGGNLLKKSEKIRINPIFP